MVATKKRVNDKDTQELANFNKELWVLSQTAQ